MTEHAAIDLENEELALTDRDLVSLYLRYPEMEETDHDFQDEVDVGHPLVPIITSSPESSPPSTQFYSSPLPNTTRYETPTSSPLGPPDSIAFPALAIAAKEQEIEELTAQFDLILKSDEIPKDTAELLAEMKSVIVLMGAILFSASGEVSANLENVRRVESAAHWLILSLKQARDVIEEEITAIESVLELAPFTVRPAAEDLWTNYKQMGEVIIEYTTIPSTRVLELSNRLCHIYDACVYRPILAVFRLQTHDDLLIDFLDSLYDAIMLFPIRYKQWMIAMKQVGDDFTKPTMRRILDLPEVMRHILEFEGQIETATKSVSEMEYATRKVFTDLNRVNRRRQHQLSRREDCVLHRCHASISQKAQSGSSAGAAEAPPCI